MNPNEFLNQREAQGLVSILIKFAGRNSSPADRQSVFKIAGIALPGLSLFTDPMNFALQLAAEFKDFCVSEQNVEYHPMLRFIEYVSEIETQYKLYNFDDDELTLLTEILTKGRENLIAIATRRSIGKIEDERGEGIGTGVLIKNDLLLTCNHVFTKTGVVKAWVRFGYKIKCDGTTAMGQKIELDLDNPIKASVRPDFALVRVKREPNIPALTIVTSPLSGGEAVRLIHHPEGGPVVVSEVGVIRQVGADYIDHNLPTSKGSSGAPIINRKWEFVAIHRGDPGVGRALSPGTTEGLPLRSIRDLLNPVIHG
jgi:S1-C subfamily serine protease